VEQEEDENPRVNGEGLVGLHAGMIEPKVLEYLGIGYRV
jgi:hypothetical protein